jgi:hypothetical protein
VRIPKLEIPPTREHALRIIEAHTIADDALEAQKALMNMLTGIAILYFISGVVLPFVALLFIVINAALSMFVLWRFHHLTNYMIELNSFVIFLKEKQEEEP